MRTQLSGNQILQKRINDELMISQKLSQFFFTISFVKRNCVEFFLDISICKSHDMIYRKLSHDK